MINSNIIRIVQYVLQYDLEPPTEEYTPYEHGVFIGHGLTEESAAALLAECLRSLPGSLASSFIEGILDVYNMAHLDEVLFQSLECVREVSSAGPIVHMLLERCNFSHRDLSIRLLSKIQGATEEGLQNTLAFALWATFRGVTRNNQALDSAVEAELSKAASYAISEYTRRILEACMSRAERGQEDPKRVG